ncbi:MAG: Fe-Mn family superoxide dismutase [Dehalococcoidales bacterium]|nr:Fe-Mn family superoxide dismutase [Dehalococcoidales bacterium]
MNYVAKDHSALIGMEGLSQQLLTNHFTLYQGYVTNTNKLMELLTTMLLEEKTATPEYAELKRRLGFEFNGMRLHEYYFENLGKKGTPDSAANLKEKLTEDFGSYENWEKDFRATGAMRGIGWVVLYQDIVTGRLFNQWINEHETGHPAGCLPILVMDVFEHAYMLDYGLKRADYINTFFQNINWEATEGRFKAAITLCP